MSSRVANQANQQISKFANQANQANQANSANSANLQIHNKTPPIRSTAINYCNSSPVHHNLVHNQEQTYWGLKNRDNRWLPDV